VVGHSGNRIPEKPVSSIGKGTGVDGVRVVSEPGSRVRGGDESLRTPSTPVPNHSDRHYQSPQRYIPGTKAHRLMPLGVESLEPPAPVTPDAAGGGHSDPAGAASPSLVGGTPNAHKYLGVPLVLVPGPRRLLW